MQDTTVIITYNPRSPYEDCLARVVEDASDGSSDSLVRYMTYASKPCRTARGEQRKSAQLDGWPVV
jgi:hypothetical protein